MGAPLVPAFAAERNIVLLDVWTPYQALIAQVLETCVERALRQPEIAPLLRGRVAHELAAQARRCRPLLLEAIPAGDWQPYVDELRLLAARCVALGVKFATWSAIAQAF